MDTPYEKGSKVELDRTADGRRGWEIEIYFQDGFYHVKSSDKGKSFYKFYKAETNAWRAYYIMRQGLCDET